MTMTFEQVYKQYNRKVYGFILSKIKDEMTAEELASDVMIKVHKSLHTYKEELSKMQTWLFNIAKNTVIDHIRKRTLSTISLQEMNGGSKGMLGGDHTKDIDHVYAIRDRDSNPEDKMIHNELARTMYEKFQTLPQNQQLIASLHFFDGLSYDEISTELNLPLGTVKATLHHARTALMTTLPVELRR